MKTLFLLVLLSQNDAGDINASFVNTEALAQCQQKEAMVQAIFSTAKIPILESRCIRSELQFSEFAHATSTSMPRHFYLIEFEKEAVNIQEVPDWKSCMSKQSREADQPRVYCSSSTQRLQR